MPVHPPRLTDPKRLRALSHPLRWRLMRVIGDEETATATRCAEVLGESVASCSYHLNMLAKYGFIEEAPSGQGREKPWRTAMERMSISTEGLDDEGRSVAAAATSAFLENQFDEIRELVPTVDDEPPEWRDLLGTTSTRLYVTAPELAELVTRVQDVIEEYTRRGAKPETRSPDARRVLLFQATLATRRPPAR